MVAIYIEGKITPNDEMSTAAVVNTICKVIPDCKVIHTYKSNKLAKIVDVNYDNLVYYDISQVRDIGWKAQYKLAKNVLIENDIDTLIVYKSIIMSGQKNGDMGQIERFRRRRKEDDFVYMKHAMSTTQYCKYLMVEAGAAVCKNNYEFILDPQEPHWGDLYNGIDYKYLYGMQREGKYIYMPCFEYGVQNAMSDTDTTKKYDMVFFCSCLTKDREFILEYKDVLESVPNSKIQINTNKVKPMGQREYYELVAKSKYSMCIPAYDKTAFSMYRFVEALAVDCLCFIHKDCCLDDIKETFPDIYAIMKKYLVYDFDGIISNISKLTDKERNDIIKDIKDTKSWKRFSDLEFIEKRWKKLLCE